MTVGAMPAVFEVDNLYTYRSDAESIVIEASCNDESDLSDEQSALTTS